MNAAVQSPPARADDSASVDLGHGLTLNGGPSARFATLPPEERERILDEFQDYLGRALDGMTLDRYLAIRRKEASHDA